MSQLVVICGLSGSGKSTAARILEDVGFRVLRNLPPFLIKESFQNALTREKSQDRVAVLPEILSEEDRDILVSVLSELESLETKVLEVFLDAANETLLNRYKESRRPHPSLKGFGIIDSIEHERSMLASIRSRAHVVIETDNLKPFQLNDVLLGQLNPDKRRKLIITFMSFGFKYGVPPEIDLCFDVRFLPNPFFVPHLKEMTGIDEPVEQFVLDKKESIDFIQKFETFFDFLLPLYEREGKTYLTIGIGCTGGRHRSVAIAQTLWKRCDKENRNVMCIHRDVQRPVLS